MHSGNWCEKKLTLVFGLHVFLFESQIPRRVGWHCWAAPAGLSNHIFFLYK